MENKWEKRKQRINCLFLFLLSLVFISWAPVKYKRNRPKKDKRYKKKKKLTKYLDTRFHSIKDVDEEDETLWNTLEMRPTRKEIKEEDGLISCFFLDFFSFTNRHIYLIHGKWRLAVSVQKKEEKETKNQVICWSIFGPQIKKQKVWPKE